MEEAMYDSFFEASEESEDVTQPMPVEDPFTKKVAVVAVVAAQESGGTSSFRSDADFDEGSNSEGEQVKTRQAEAETGYPSISPVASSRLEFAYQSKNQQSYNEKFTKLSQGTARHSFFQE